MARKGAPRRSAYHGALVPGGPTGRMVITKVTGGTSGGAQDVHWCPSKGEEWTCPDCRLEFVREDQQWRERLSSATA